MEEAAKEVKQTSVRERSPNYPVIGLSEAIKRIKLIYQEERRNSMPSEIAAKHLGYTSLNGHARSILSALKKYGLLVGDGGALKVGEDGVAICVYAEGSPERSEAIKRAANRPEIFREILKEFPDGLGSDSNLRAKLIMKRGFTESAALTFIRALRETIQLADSGIVRNSDSKESPEMEPLPMDEPNNVRESITFQPSSSAKDVPYFRFSVDGATVEFRANAPLTARHFALINAYLKAYEDGAKSESTKQAPATPAAVASERASDANQDIDKVASVGFMITKAQKAQLRDRGHSDDEIARMKPDEAHKLLGLS